MPLPLPSYLQDANLIKNGDHLRYPYYVYTSNTVNPDGSVKELASDQKGVRLAEICNRANEALIRMKASVQALSRRTKALADAHGEAGFAVSLPLQTPFLTGMGYQNDLEVGFTLHHTYGVPYLPGSGLKGVVRAWYEQSGASKATLTRLFGSPDKLKEGDESKHQVGAIRFLDVLPLENVRMQVDVLTPHFAPYYQDPTREVPAVWHDPNPVPFLSVKAGSTFQFVLLARLGEMKDGCTTPEEFKEVQDNLVNALAWLGAGGKTSNGYGRFGDINRLIFG